MTVKNVINSVLSVFAPLAAVPTGWAIFAGVTEQPAFPMPSWAAAIGAVSIVMVDVQAGMLVTDIKTFNKSLRNKTELKELTMSPLRAWLILITAIIAEIVLSLVVVVLDGWLAYGVVVFPILTGAGIFAFATRLDLQEREASRDELRDERAKKRTKPAPKPAEPAPQPATEPEQPAFICSKCEPDRSFGSQAALNAHQRSHKPIAYAVELTPIEKVKVQ